MGVRRDVFYANWLCKKKNVLNREKIYFETNEDLDKIFKDIDFSDKDVLSVLASSDQLFKLNSLDTKSIETFDKNKLTYYYYYFRVWTIKYMKELYPTALIIGDDYWIDTLLSLVNPETEEEKQALYFWDSLFKKDVAFSRIFIWNKVALLDYNRDFSGCSIPSKLSFYNFDLFKNNKFDKRYDIAVISNILEWTHGDSRYIERLENNLSNLLNNGGLVLCSKIIHKNEINGVCLKNILREKFELQDDDNNRYVYIKK